MTSPSAPTQPAPKRRRFLRFALWGLALVVVLVVALYFVATSSAFLKSVILPRVSQRLGAEVAVESASIKPFSGIRLANLTVRTTGDPPLLSVREAAVQYSLWDILRGNYRIESITVLQPAVELVQNADGTSNLDPILEALAKMGGETAAPEPAAPAEPMALELASLNVQGAVVRVTRHHAGDQKDVFEVTDAGLTLSDVKNGGTATLKLKAGLGANLNPPAPGAVGSVRSTLAGEFKLGLSQDLQPTQIQGNARVDVEEATGALAEAQSLAVALDTDVTPEAIRKAALRAFKGRTLLAELTCEGPFDLAKREGRLIVGAKGIDRQLLNLAGTPFGVDFGRTAIQSTNLVTLANQAQTIQIAGRLDVGQFSLTRSNLTTPTIDLGLAYDVNADLAAGRAVLRALNLDGRQNNQPLLTGGLVKPMTLDWSSGQAGAEESALSLTLTNLNLADWAQFTGGMVEAGRVAAHVDLTSRQAGRQLVTHVDGRISGLSAMAGTNRFDQLGLAMTLDTQVDDFKRVALRQAKLGVTHAGATLAGATAQGVVDAQTMAADLQTTLRLMIPPALKLAALPDADFTAGAVTAEAHVVQQPTAGDAPPVQTLTGKLTLQPLSGRYADYTLDRLAADGEFDLQMQGTRITIRKLTNALSHAGQAAGRVSLDGRWDLEANRGEIKLAAHDLNQHLLAPFVQPALADKQLRSVAIQADSSVRFDPAAASSIQATLSVTNLVVHDPSGTLPEAPLAARARIDTAMTGQVIELRQTRLELDPTERAENAVDLTGKVDLSATNAITGNLKLAAASLDVTPWYDLFVSGPAKETAPAQPTPAPAPSTGPETEPPPVQLPFKDFVMEAQIGQFYLREVLITNLQSRVVIDGGHVVVKPARLALNGAPAEASVDLDLGVPGYRYDLDVKATDIPLAPLVNTFQPERKGQIAGTVTAGGEIRGAGVTGASLQKNLAGQFNFATTNMNLKVVNVRSSVLKSILNVIIGLPDLIRNPQEAVTGLVGKLTETLAGQGQGQGGGGWVDEVAESPINVIEANGRIGEGVVNLERAFVQSPAFQVETHGTIRLASVLTNSTLDLPVMVTLRRELADKVGLVPADAPTNAVFVTLPHFLTMQGTVGEPKKKLNLAALLKITSKVAAGLVGNSGEAVVDQATGAVEAVGGLLGIPLGGDKSTNAPPQEPGANQPQSEEPKLPKLPVNPFKLFDRN